ncbi:hypothetical protein AHAS_Ahas11G0024600 [Arachis hypogaea]
MNPAKLHSLSLIATVAQSLTSPFNSRSTPPPSLTNPPHLAQSLISPMSLTELASLPLLSLPSVSSPPHLSGLQSLVAVHLVVPPSSLIVSLQQ